MLQLCAHDDVLLCRRTTLEITDELMRRAKKMAAEQGVPLREVVEAALRDYLCGTRNKPGNRLRWTPERGELLAGAHVEDRESLLDFMDEIR